MYIDILGLNVELWTDFMLCCCPLLLFVNKETWHYGPLLRTYSYAWLCVQLVFEGMEESGSEGLDDLLLKLRGEGWMKVWSCHLTKLCSFITFQWIPGFNKWVHGQGATATCGLKENDNYGQMSQKRNISADEMCSKICASCGLGSCRISAPRFLAECRKRRLN